MNLRLICFYIILTRISGINWDWLSGCVNRLNKLKQCSKYMYKYCVNQCRFPIDRRINIQKVATTFKSRQQDYSVSVSTFMPQCTSSLGICLLQIVCWYRPAPALWNGSHLIIFHHVKWQHDMLFYSVTFGCSEPADCIRCEESPCYYEPLVTVCVCGVVVRVGGSCRHVGH